MTDETVSGSVVAVPLTSGVTVLVHTLTPLVFQRLVIQAESLFPLPDKAAYEKPLPNALPGTDAKKDVEKDPEYLKALNDAYTAQAQWLLDAVLDVAVTAENEAEIVAYYAPKVEKLRKRGALVEHDGDSDFMIVLRNFLAHDVRDLNRLTAAAQMKVPLSEVETRDGRAYFRLATRQSPDRRSAVQRLTPRVERKTADQAEPSLDGDRDSA